MKFSKRIEAMQSSPVRKLVPYAQEDAGRAESRSVYPNVPAEETDPEKGRRYVPEAFHGVLFQHGTRL